VAVIRQLVTASVAEEPHPRNRLRPRRHRRTGDGQIFGSRNAARRRAYGGGNPADRSRPSLSDRQRCSVAGTLSIVTYVQETFLRRSWSTSRSQKSVLRRAIMSIGPVRAIPNGGSDGGQDRKTEIHISAWHHVRSWTLSGHRPARCTSRRFLVASKCLGEERVLKIVV
jgi:hypothetical protein